MYIRRELHQEACTSALLLRSPARALRLTLHCAGPTRQGDDTICPELEETGPEDTEKSDPSGWSGSPCAVLRVVSGAPVALLAHLVLDKPVRVGERGTGLSAVKLGPFRCCKEARWSSTCLFTLDAGCLRGAAFGNCSNRLRACCLLTCRDLGLDGLRGLISKALQLACLARAQGRRGCPCLSADDDTLKAPAMKQAPMQMMDTANIKSASSDTGRDKSSSSSVDWLEAPTT